MSQSSNLNRRLVERSIAKGTKQVIAASRVIDSSTRSGNKELHHLIKRLAQQPFSSLAAATALGEAVGHKVVEQSQQMGRTYLDQGVIRQLLLNPDLADLFVGAGSATDSKLSSVQRSVQLHSTSTQEEAIAEDVRPAIQEEVAAEEEEIDASREQENQDVENSIEEEDDEIENSTEEEDEATLETQEQGIDESIDDEPETEEVLDQETEDFIEDEGGLEQETDEEITNSIENTEVDLENAVEDDEDTRTIESLIDAEIEEDTEEADLENAIEDDQEEDEQASDSEPLSELAPH